MAIGNEHEAYVEIRVEWGRLAGGTREEIEDFWKRTEYDTGALPSRMLLRDGTELAKRPPGSKRLHDAIKKRLADKCECGHAFDDHFHSECEEEGCGCVMPDLDEVLESDTKLIQEMAELLGIDL